MRLLSHAQNFPRNASLLSAAGVQTSSRAAMRALIIDISALRSCFTSRQLARRGELANVRGWH